MGLRPDLVGLMLSPVVRVSVELTCGTPSRGRGGLLGGENAQTYGGPRVGGEALCVSKGDLRRKTD